MNFKYMDKADAASSWSGYGRSMITFVNTNKKTWDDVTFLGHIAIDRISRGAGYEAMIDVWNGYDFKKVYNQAAFWSYIMLNVFNAEGD